MSDTDSPPASRPVALVRAVVRHALENDVPFMAGAIAYQASVSLLPLLFLLVVIALAVGESNLAGRLLSITVGQFPADARGLVREAVRNAVTRTGNSIVGVAVLGFGAFAVFNGFDKAFTELYGTERGGTLPNQLRDAAVVLAALVGALLSIATTWRLLVIPASLPFSGLIRAGVLTAGLVVTFYPMFYVFPEVPLGWREVLPGVVVAAVGWTALQAAFRFYVRFVSRSEAFGVISGVLLLATWLYFSGFVLLLGGTLNAVLHGRGVEGPGDDAGNDAPRRRTDGDRETDRD